MRPILLPGAIAGVALGFAFIAFHVSAPGLSYAAQETLGLLAIVVATATGQLFAVRAHPERRAPYPARYFAAMFAAAGTAIVYGVMTWLHFTLIDPDHLSRFYASYLERARARAATPAEAERLLAAAERMHDFVVDPLSQALMQFGTVLMAGLLTGALIAALVKPPGDPSR